MYGLWWTSSLAAFNGSCLWRAAACLRAGLFNGPVITCSKKRSRKERVHKLRVQHSLVVAGARMSRQLFGIYPQEGPEVCSGQPGMF